MCISLKFLFSKYILPTKVNKPASKAGHPYFEAGM
jgi:hypothetical protein